MTISELIVKLGFKVEGAEKLAAVDSALTNSYFGSIKLLASLTALNAGFVAILATAANAAVGFNRFTATTGQSAIELQQWQMAARQFNVSGDEMANTVKSITTARANLLLRGEGFAPWQFFGISPNQTPFEIMRQLSGQFQKLDPTIARVMAQQLGITENMFVFLRQGNLDLTRFNQQLILTERQQANLLQMNKGWQQLLFSLSAVKNRFAEAFSGPATMALTFLKGALDLLATLVDRLGRATPAAEAVRWALAGVVAAVGLLTAALVPGALEIGTFVGALSGLLLLWDDFQTAVSKGQDHALFDWGPEIAAVNALADGLERVAGWWRKLRELQANNRREDFKGTWRDPALNSFWMNMFIPGSGTAFEETVRRLDEMAAVPVKNGVPQSTDQTNYVTIHVHGATDPVATGRQVAKTFKEVMAEAYRQMPLPAQ